MGVSPVTHLNWIFSLINHPAIGVPAIYGNPPFIIVKVRVNSPVVNQ